MPDKAAKGAASSTFFANSHHRLSALMQNSHPPHGKHSGVILAMYSRQGMSYPASLDKASAFPCFNPGLCFITMWYCDSSSILLADWPCGSFLARSQFLLQLRHHLAARSCLMTAAFPARSCLLIQLRISPCSQKLLCDRCVVR